MKQVTPKALKAAMAKAKKAIANAKTIAITGHVNPDGDSIGSVLSLGLGLKALGKKVTFLSPDPFPERFFYLTGAKQIRHQYRGVPDLMIAVDCAAPKRVGAFAELFEKAPMTLQVDHHGFGQDFCEIEVVNTQAASTTEIIFDFLKYLKVDYTKAIGKAILTGVITDTGSFRLSNTSAKTMRLAATLIELGINWRELTEQVFWMRSEAELRLASLSMNNLEVSRKGKVIISQIEQRDFNKHGGEMADVEEVPNEMLGLEGAQVAAFLREQENGKYRVSLRSKPGINIAQVAKQFGGGGHTNAAGCILKNDKTDKKSLVKALEALV